ncbi:MAG: tetratricopeptide repeat protein [Campylobacterales bacterium]|nr:tetratricopeptide repeat protein [Campylobacterales bacterium]
MKKLILVLGLVVSVYSATYQDGVNLFKSKDYQRAYELFNSILFDNFSSVKVNYYLGRSAFEIGEYNQAIASYERVLTLDPNHHLSRLELARTYFVLKLYQQSQIEFETVKEGKIPTQVVKTVDSFLESIKEKKKKSRWSGNIILGVKNDSNVFNTKEDEKSSLAHMEGISLANSYKNSRYTLRSGGGIYMENYTDSEGKKGNFKYPYLFVGPQLEKEKYSFYMPLTISSLQYDNQWIMKIITAKVEATHKKIPEFFLKREFNYLQTYGELSIKDHRDKDNGKDGKAFKIGGIGKQQHSKGILTYDMSYHMERKNRSSTRYDIDHNLYQIKAGLLSDKFSKKVIINIEGSLGLRFDNDKHLIADKYRNDRTLKLSATGIYPVGKQSGLMGNLGYTVNKSSVKDYDYKKMIVGINYVYNFSDRQLRRVYNKLGGGK